MCSSQYSSITSRRSYSDFAHGWVFNSVLELNLPCFGTSPFNLDPYNHHNRRKVLGDPAVQAGIHKSSYYHNNSSAHIHLRHQKTSSSRRTSISLGKETYRIGNLLGKGSFGEVFTIQSIDDPRSKPLALKVHIEFLHTCGCRLIHSLIAKIEKSSEYLMWELHIICSLHSREHLADFIPQVQGLFHFKVGSNWLIFMPKLTSSLEHVLPCNGERNLFAA